MHLPSGEESSDDGRFDDDDENSNSEVGAEESNTEQSLEFPDDLSPPTCDLQESDFDGDWNRGTICGRTLTWNEGEVVALTIISGRTLQLTYVGSAYTGELQDDGRLHWDDGDIWTRRHQSSSPTAALQASDCDGEWNRGTICGRTLTWNEGEAVTLKIITARKLQLTYLGTTYTGELRDDSRLHWDDGDIWTRPHLKSTVVVPSGCLITPLRLTTTGARSAKPCCQQKPEEDVQRQVAPSPPSAPKMSEIGGGLAARVAAKSVHRRTLRDISVAIESSSPSGALVAAEAVKAQPAAVPISQKRYEGIVKYFRGAFGWVVCEELSAVYRGFDVFLHKRDCDAVPKQNDKVSFRLCLDDLGNPKGVDARLVKAPDMVSARDWFSRGR